MRRVHDYSGKHVPILHTSACAFLIIFWFPVQSFTGGKIRSVEGGILSGLIDAECINGIDVSRADTGQTFTRLKVESVWKYASKSLLCTQWPKADECISYRLQKQGWFGNQKLQCKASKVAELTRGYRFFTSRMMRFCGWPKGQSKSSSAIQKRKARPSETYVSEKLCPLPWFHSISV